VGDDRGLEAAAERRRLADVDDRREHAPAWRRGVLTLGVRAATTPSRSRRRTATGRIDRDGSATVSTDRGQYV
jgi:hypothetical protein